VYFCVARCFCVFKGVVGTVDGAALRVTRNTQMSRFTLVKEVVNESCHTLGDCTYGKLQMRPFTLVDEFMNESCPILGGCTEGEL